MKTLEELVNENYSKLNENDLYIWNFILKHKKSCYNLSIENFAMKCNVSRSTILRFAKKISLKGFSELKVYLKLEALHTTDKKHISIDNIINDYSILIDDMKNKDCTNIFKLLDTAENLYVYGSGAVQHSAARELKRIFSQAHKRFFHIEGVDETVSILDMMTEKDMVIIISLTGDSPVVRRLAENLKLHNIPIVAITKLKNSTLARNSGDCIYINTTSYIDTGFNDKTFEATAYYFILVEMLFLKYIQYKNHLKQEKETLAKQSVKL